MKVLITGDHDGLPKGLKIRGRSVEWVELPVLQFEALPVDPAVKKRLLAEPPDWIIFTSRKGVEFWNQALGKIPSPSKLAAIGPATAEGLGEAVVFVPTQSGSEGFLEEFTEKVKVKGLRLLIPAAEQGRRLIDEKLTQQGALVERLALYRTLPRTAIAPIPAGISALVLTSPSSVEALLSKGPLPNGLRLVSIGRYTSDSLKRHGHEGFKEIPEGDLARVTEVL